MKIFSADKVFPVDAPSIAQGYVAIRDDGTIDTVGSQDNLPDTDIIKLRGWIIPGMVNAHCHLELSHLVGRVDTGTGLLPFLQKVVTLREVEESLILDAITDQDTYMYDHGIVAVGDICNTTHTHSTKIKSPIRYYSFVEMFDFMKQPMAQATFAKYKAVYDGHQADKKDKKSCVPHAPYTVSKDLYTAINKVNSAEDTVSVHNQETPSENELFIEGTGGFHDFFSQFGFLYPEDVKTGKPSIYTLLNQMDRKCKTLFVHNTLTTESDIMAAHAWSDRVYWATCPNANLYIENRLPDYQVFKSTDATVCIGTDSLTSNWQLDVWEEVKTLLRYKSYLSAEEVIKWATLNGAEALSMDDQLGSITPGKKCGLVNITSTSKFENRLDISRSEARRIVV